ncbi:MAG: hypothetical protein ACP5VE_10670 [Chthonomonadales bacterium]
MKVSGGLPVHPHSMDHFIRRSVRRAARQISGAIRHRFPSWELRRRMEQYRSDPELFAQEVLGSRWWFRQREVARAVASSRRTIVKSGNGVGKTYLAADLALWFLYSFPGSTVLTTAPTWRQVRHVLWEEIRRRFHSALKPLPGVLLTTRICAGDGWHALGLATTDGVRFQGFHAENLLVLLDEAGGIPAEIWDAVEGVAVGANNRILAIGNPLHTSGRFYEIFRGAGEWSRITVNALEHPNIAGDEPVVPGAVTRDAVRQRIAEWCEEVPGNGPDGADLLLWEGKRYRPGNLFRTRVLGEFPDADDDALIPLRWVEAAMHRTLPQVGERRMAVDVARFGGDATVIGCRVGPVLTHMEVIRGADTMDVAGRIVARAYCFHPQSIAVDSIGVGAGVVDRLMELQLEGVEAVNVALPAWDGERFANRRAELYWALRERLRTGEIALPQDEQLCLELAAIRYRHTSQGKIQIESKEEMKRRGLASPDRADMAALLFDGPLPTLSNDGRVSVEAPPSEALRREMDGW